MTAYEDEFELLSDPVPEPPWVPQPRVVDDNGNVLPTSILDSPIIAAAPIEAAEGNHVCNWGNKHSVAAMYVQPGQIRVEWTINCITIINVDTDEDDDGFTSDENIRMWVYDHELGSDEDDTVDIKIFRHPADEQ